MRSYLYRQPFFSISLPRACSELLYSCSPLMFWCFLILRYLVKAQLNKVDAKAVVTLLNSHGSSLASSHQCSTLIIDCRSSSSFFNKSHIHHIFCEGNHCKDLFINQRSSINNSFILYLHPPSSILYQLLVDTWGVSYPRLCIL